MKKIITVDTILTGMLLLCFGIFTVYADAKYTIAKDKKTDYVLVMKNNGNTEAEKFAVEELKNHLLKITGIEFKVVIESDLKGPGKRIYVGQTDFAKKNNVAFSELGEEEWVIKTIDGNLILSGGRTRGTIYAVYEFLEKFAGCHWLAEDTTVIPLTPEFAIPEINAKGKPAFWLRTFLAPIQTNKEDESIAFLARNKNNHVGLTAKHGFIEKTGSPGLCHTFYAYSKDWPTEHPEYFSMPADGKRLRAVNNAGPGQICLTNPEVRTLIYEKLKNFIKNDRTEAVKNGFPPPRVYDISQNDTNNQCLCPSCKALMEQEGVYSGVLLDFINDIADRIKTEYPDVVIQTFAYMFTIEPPKTIRPRNNVMIRVCNLGGEHGAGGISEPIRPINSEFNDRFRNYLARWAEISKNISLWDYWVIYSKQFSFPYLDLDKICNDMKYFKKSNVQNMVIECEYDTKIVFPSSFYPLKRWISLKLMDNPSQDTNTLIKIFMDGFYGPASDDMTKYLNYLDTNTKSEKGSLSSRFPYMYGYLLNEQFYKDANSMLDNAEAKCKDNSLYLNHVRFERAIIDSALLHMWSKLEKKNNGKALPFDRKNIIERYKKTRTVLINLWNDWSRSKETRLAALDSEINTFQISVPLPEEFENKDVVDMIWMDFRMTGGGSIADDPLGAGGKGMRLGDFKDLPKYKDCTDFHKKQFTMGIYNNLSKNLAINFELNDIPTDEKYHLYKIGTCNITEGTIFWAHWSWYIHFEIDKYIDQSFSNNERDVYVSLKLTGPSYVSGSTQPDAVWVDRIITVKSENKNGK